MVENFLIRCTIDLVLSPQQRAICKLVELGVAMALQDQ
jgi:hypothetical protein